MVILAAGLGLWYLTTAKGERNEPIAFTQVPIGDSAAATIDAIRNTLAPTGPYDQVSWVGQATTHNGTTTQVAVTYRWPGQHQRCWTRTDTGTHQQRGPCDHLPIPAGGHRITFTATQAYQQDEHHVQALD